MSAPLDWPARLARLAEGSRDPRLRAFYAAGCASAETPLGEAQLVALDIETTGLDAGRDAIVSIGLQPFDLRRIRCQEARYWLVQPHGALHARSVTLHHLTHSTLHQAPDFAEHFEALLDALAGRIAVVHYQHIERPFLAAAVQRLCGERWQFPLIDSMALEARLHPTRRPRWLQRWWPERRPSLHLTDCRNRYHLPGYHSHHALADALACAELLQAQSAWHYPASTPLGALWQ